jgi:hypothetical protein
MNLFSGKRPGLRIGLSLLLLAGPAAAISPGQPAPPPAQCIWDGVERIVAVGDLHGDYENFLQILKGVNLVEETAEGVHWIGGRTHLVQTGDVMDRGDRAKDIFDLIKHLEVEAPKAGGMVHLLLGNHEELNIMNRSRLYPGYISINQFLDFIGPKNRAVLENQQKRRANYPERLFYTDLMKDPESKWWNEYHEYFLENYGRWLVEHNVIIKINETVFVHGGITLEYSRYPLQEINEGYRREFLKLIPAPDEISITRWVFAGPRTPLWDRELSLDDPSPELENVVDQILANLGAAHIVVAHTPTVIEDNMRRFGGKVWIIDTGISRVYQDGHNGALQIENGQFKIFWGDDAKRKTLRDPWSGMLGFAVGGLFIFDRPTPAPRIP